MQAVGWLVKCVRRETVAPSKCDEILIPKQHADQTEKTPALYQLTDLMGLRKK